MARTLPELLEHHVAQGTAPGILVACGRPGEPLAYTSAGDVSNDVFEPLGMLDTGYTVPQDEAHRLPAAYRHDDTRGLVEIEPTAGGFYVAPAPFDLSHAELVSTASDYAIFASMLAADGRHDDRVILDRALLEQLRSDQVPASAKTDDSFRLVMTQVEMGPQVIALFSEVLA